MKIRTVTLWFLWAMVDWHPCMIICTSTWIFSCGNKNGVQNLRYYKLRLLLMYVPHSGGERGVTASFIGDLCSAARVYLWTEQDLYMGKETKPKSGLMGISFRRQHCVWIDKQDLSGFVGLQQKARGQGARADCFPQILPGLLLKQAQQTSLFS